MNVRAALVLTMTAAACASSATNVPASANSSATPPAGEEGPRVSLGELHEGDYALGPVAWRGSFHNSCSPYLPETERRYGEHLAGVSLAYNGQGQLCDACLEIETRLGKKVLARIVTTGETKADGDVDLSQASFDAIYQLDPEGTSERPRPMRWRLVQCPNGAPLAFQFQTGAHEHWTSFWVRNPRKPIANVEVRSSNHANYHGLRRETDGNWNDDQGFGRGAFSLRLTAVDGSTLEESFEGFSAGALLQGTQNFD